ncbi:Multidrug and toxin extrusion protein [Fasciola gigantica]|uniref:Multidrug and toxin extrusion protein n=1 Tax=Fasciola gigantica TaxID=46835 RepID=A0A504YK34_FASGI|nr:Multidrug and toxin extrusion protein [Fasciola gigantica]
MSAYNIGGMFVVTGLLTASETIFAQTYGSGAENEMNMQFMRAIALITMCCLPCASLYVVAEPIMLLLRQNPLIAKLSAQLLLKLIPVLLLAAWGQVLLYFLHAQNQVYAPLFIIGASNGVNVLLHHVLIYYTNLRLTSTAVAQGASYLFQDICLFCFIQFSKSVTKIRPVFSRSFLENWGVWFKLAVPGIIMVSTEFTHFELGNFIAGSLGSHELGVQTVLNTLDTVTYSILPHGFGTAASICVGHYLGAGCAHGPRSTLSVALLVMWSSTPVCFIIVLCLREYIPSLFSKDKAVIEDAARIIPITLLFQFLDGTNAVSIGVIKGSGLQKYGAITNFFTLYILGAPMTIWFVYNMNMGLKGIWFGMIAGACLQSVILITICYRINWDEQVISAAERIQIDEKLEEMQTLTPTEFEMLPFDDSLEMLAEEPKNETPEEELNLSEDNANASQRDSKVRPILSQRKTSNFGLICCSPSQSSRPALKKSPPVSCRRSYSKTVRSRIILFTSMLIMLLCSIACRFLINWSAFLGIYCVYPNETFVRVKGSLPLGNCTIVIP